MTEPMQASGSLRCAPLTASQQAERLQARMLDGGTVLLAGLAGAGAWPMAPALAAVLPLLWITAAHRWVAALAGAAYSLAAVRFLPSMGGAWYDSALIGWSLWLAIGAVAGLAYGVCWRAARTWGAASGATLALLLTTLLLGAVLPGHAFFGWGYLVPGWGWTGLVAMMLITVAGSITLQVWLPRWRRYRPWTSLAVVAALGVFVALIADRPTPGGGRLAGRIGALQTAWGGYPEPDSIKVIERIEKIGRATEALTGGEGALTTVVFPENVLGRYDLALEPVVKMEVGNRIRETGQTVLVGADVAIGQGRFHNALLVLRPDGGTSWLQARQTTPVAQWKPWAEGHMPADWLAPSVVELPEGGRARVMFCHEEYMAILHLLSEWREPHQLVIAVANLWAAEDDLPNAIQAAHLEGAAKLWRRPWIRAVNGPTAKPAAK